MQTAETTTPDFLALLQNVADGDDHALAKLFGLVEAEIARRASGLSILRSKGRTQPDDIAQVRMYAFTRLKNQRATSLSRFLAQAQAQELGASMPFSRWLARLVRYAAMDHLREYYGRRPAVPSAQNGRLQPSVADVNRPGEEDVDAGHRSYIGVTKRLTIAEINKFIAEELTRDEASALMMHFADHTLDEIAQSLGLASADQADKLVRRLKAKLRHRFRTQAE
jgi:DNA-directed RNA polymerase specialized sigma24 family protein